MEVCEASPVARFRELLQALCCTHSTMVVMLRCYLDESVSYKNSLPNRITIGGCLARADHWEELTAKWTVALHKEGVTEFRMSQFENYQGEFSRKNGWSEERHKDFLGILLEIIDEHVDDFVGSTYLGIESVKKSYYWVAKMVVFNLQNLFTDYLGDDLAMFYAAHPEGKIGPISQYFEEYFDFLGESVTFSIGRPSKLLPLQVADLLAYEIRKNEGRSLDDLDKMRYPLKRLVTSRRKHRWAIAP